MDKPIIRRYSFEVAGVSHRLEIFLGAKVLPGDQLSLEREPGNKHDPNAIKVLKGRLHFGYVPKNAVQEVMGLMARYTGKLVVDSVWFSGCIVSMECVNKS